MRLSRTGSVAVCLPYQNHAVANDPRASEYDPAKPDSIIGYWDANIRGEVRAHSWGTPWYHTFFVPPPRGP